MPLDPPVYFFCDHVYDLTLFRGIAVRIKERQPSRRCVAIIDSSPNVVRYDVDRMLGIFDEVIRVGYASYGGLGAFWRAVRLKLELRQLHLEAGALLFISSGRFLISQLLLRRLARSGMTTVWITVRSTSAPEDLVYDFFASAVYNIYHLLFGVSYVDVYRVRGSDQERLRNIQHREDPYAYTFFLVNHDGHLSSNELCYPAPPSVERGNNERVVIFCGNMISNRPWIKSDQLREGLNECLSTIKVIHEGARLIYLPHPRETPADREGLQLEGFELESGVNAEYLFVTLGRIEAVYSLWSTSVHSAERFGIRSYWLYRLFAGESLGEAYAAHFDLRFSGMPPQKFIEDLSLWRSGANNYLPAADPARRQQSLDRMLDRIGCR